MSSSSNVVVPDLASPASSGDSAAASPQASGSENSSSTVSLRGGNIAPVAEAEADAVEEAPAALLGRGKRSHKAPGRFNETGEKPLTFAELIQRAKPSSMASASQAGEPSRKRSRAAGAVQVQATAPQPSTREPTCPRQDDPILDLPQVMAPASSIGIQTDAISTPTAKQDATTITESSQHVDAGVQTTGHDSLEGLNVDTPSIFANFPDFEHEPVNDFPVPTEDEPSCSNSSPSSPSVSDCGTQTESVCNLELSKSSSESSSPPSVSNIGTLTDFAFSLELTEVSSESWMPPPMSDSASQADPLDSRRSLEFSSVSFVDVFPPAPQDPVEEEPSSSSSNPAGDALTAHFERTTSRISPPSSSAQPCIAGKLRSRDLVPRHQLREQPKRACAPRQLTMLDVAVVVKELTEEEIASYLAPPPTTRQQFQKRLEDWGIGDKEFMVEWARGEKLLAKSDASDIFIWENGHEFMANVEHCHGVHLVKNKEGLGMKVPEDLDFDTVRDYIKTNKQVGVINSTTQGTEYMTMSKLLEEFAKAERTTIYNLLSLEFAQTEDRLKAAFEEPDFVKSYSMVMKLEKALEDLRKKLGRKLAAASSQEDKEKLKGGMDKIDNQLKTMPKFQKFLLLSMTDSFTNIHVDFSGTSVFYHVIKGRKIFYVAPPTPENLELYKKFERKEFGDDWIGDALFEQWVRIEIREGQTAMIPSGYLHFVYTPEDSIVIGGNYLIEKFVEMQFEMTKLEDLCVHKKHIGEGNLFRGFWDAMWSFAEHCLIPELFESRQPRLVEMAKIFSEELVLKMEQEELFRKEEEEEKKKKKKTLQVVGDQKKDDVDVNKPWYTCVEKKQILKKLERLSQ